VEGAEVRLVDDTGADVPCGEIGELLIRGANVFAGYWNVQPQQSKA
jgi:long-chain acyl-CoA synthetase